MKRLSVRISDSLDGAIRALARQRRISKSALVREALERRILAKPSAAISKPPSLLETLMAVGPIKLAPRNQPGWTDRRRENALKIVARKRKHSVTSAAAR